MTNDSKKNCHTNFIRAAPNTFLTPISLERLIELAVFKLMKFMQAMIRINAAIDEKNRIYPPVKPDRDEHLYGYQPKALMHRCFLRTYRTRDHISSHDPGFFYSPQQSYWIC